jgi:hypothetical protein
MSRLHNGKAINASIAGLMAATCRGSISLTEHGVLRRALHSLLTVVAIMLGLFPTTLGAQQLAPSSLDLTPEQIHLAFVQAGYVVEEPITLDWTSPRVATFRVYDARTNPCTSGERWELGGFDRVLMVLVYSDTATARAEQLNAHAHEEIARGRGIPFNDIEGPYLVPGYGRSTWQHNVALVQSTEHELRRLYAAEHERDQGLTSPVPVPALAYMVDDDFRAAIVNAPRIDL